MVGERAEVEEAEELARALAGRRLLAADPREPERVRQDVAARAAVDPDHDVLEHGQRREEREVLERPPDAERRDAMGRQPEDRAAVEADVASVGRVEAAQAVEERRLAGAVRADEADDRSLVHVERDGVEREDAPETDREVVNGQDRHQARANFTTASSAGDWARRARA